DGQARLHHLTSKRATLSREIDCRSNGLPRTCTSVASARPTVTCSGSTPEAPAASPGASSRLTATTPLASVTSTQDPLLVRKTTIPLAGVARSLAATVAGADAAAAEDAGLAALAGVKFLAGTAADAGDAAPAGNVPDAAAIAAIGCATLAAGSRTVPGTATGGAGETAFGELVAADTPSSRCIEGSSISTSAPSSSANTIRYTGLESRLSHVGAVPSPGARNGALMPSSVWIRRGAAVWGSRSSTCWGSILRVRHTVAASARANTASGKRSQRSCSSASSLDAGTFSDTANAATCSPAASRARRSSAPAVAASAAAGWPAPSPMPSCAQDSLIESPSCVRGGLARLRKPFPELFTQLLHGNPVVHAALDLDTQPQRLGIGLIAVVQAPDVELGAGEVAPLEQQGRQVVAGHRVARIQLVGARQAALGVGRSAGARLAQSLGHQRLGPAGIERIGHRHLEGAQRLVIAALLAKQPAVVVLHVGVARVQRGGAAETLLGLPVVVQPHVDQAAQVVRIRKTRVGGDDLLEFVECHVGLALLEIPDRQLHPDTRPLAPLGLVGFGHDVARCGSVAARSPRGATGQGEQQRGGQPGPGQASSRVPDGPFHGVMSPSHRVPVPAPASSSRCAAARCVRPRGCDP